MKKRSNAKIAVDSLDIGGVYRAIRIGGNRAIADSFAEQSFCDRALLSDCFSNRLCSDGAKVRCDFIGQHFLKTETKQMGRVTAVRSRHHVAAKACCSARSTVTGGTAISEARADR